jgi:peroxiredoxin family protein
MDYDEDDFYDGVTVGVGAATALEDMADSDIQLLV